MSKRFTTRLDEDDYGDLILTIPYEVCEELGWDTESELVYDASEKIRRLNSREAFLKLL